MLNITKKDLLKIPYLNHKELGNRTIVTLMFYDEGEWHWWIPCKKGLIKAKGYPTEMLYFAKQPERRDDICLGFINFIGQHACWNELVKPFNGLQDDIHNICASLKKFNILFEYSKQEEDGVSRLVITEMEYLFGLCRSIFDLLQEMISHLWESFQFSDPKLKKKPLPKAFRKIVYHGGELCNKAQLIEKFGMPESMADFYIRNKAFFSVLRKFRDNIFHHGSTFKIIFVTEKGFAIPGDLKPFCDFNIWNEEHKSENNLCSLRPALAYLINQTLLVCEDFSQMIQTTIKFPDPIVPNMKLFIRGYLNDELIQIPDILKNCSWWGT